MVKTKIGCDHEMKCIRLTGEMEVINTALKSWYNKRLRVKSYKIKIGMNEKTVNDSEMGMKQRWGEMKWDETTNLGEYRRYQSWESIGVYTKEERKSERDRFLTFTEKEMLKDQRQASLILGKE